MSVTEQTRRLLNTAEVAELLGLSMVQTRRLYEPLGAFHIGRVVRFDPERVESFIDQRKAEAEAKQTGAAA